MRGPLAVTPRARTTRSYSTQMSLTCGLVASGMLHLDGTIAHRLAHNYNYKLYNVRMLSFVLTGLDHGEYTTYRLCVITW